MAKNGILQFISSVGRYFTPVHTACTAVLQRTAPQEQQLEKSQKMQDKISTCKAKVIIFKREEKSYDIEALQLIRKMSNTKLKVEFHHNLVVTQNFIQT